MRVALYARVSTGAQAKEGFSLETQERLARERCALADWTMPDVYQDVMSGRKDSRPDLKRMMDDAAAGRIDVVLVYRFDRLGRSMVHTLQVIGELADMGVRVISLTQPFEITGTLGKLMLAIYTSFAEMESDAIGARVRDNRRQRLQAEGKHYVKPPYGYARIDGKMVIAEEEAQFVRQVFEGLSAGRSLRSIAIDLNQQGSRTANGNLWSHVSLHVMASCVTYKGMLTHGRRGVKRTSKGRIVREKAATGDYLLVEGSHEPIVSADLWDDVQQKLAANKGMSPRTAGAASRRPWSAVLRCGHCGRRLSTAGSAGVVKFICSTKGALGPDACPLGSITMPLLSGALVRAMAGPLAHGGKAASRRKPKGEPRAVDHGKAIAKLEAAIARESDLYRIGAQNLATTEARVKALRQEVETLKAAEPTAPKAPPRFDDFVEVWSGLPDEDRAGLIRSLVERVTLNDDDILLEWRPEFRDHLGEGLTVKRPRLRGTAAARYAL